MKTEINPDLKRGKGFSTLKGYTKLIMGDSQTPKQFFSTDAMIKIQGVTQFGDNIGIEPRPYQSQTEMRERVEAYKEEHQLRSAFAVRIDSLYILYRTPVKYRKTKTK